MLVFLFVILFAIGLLCAVVLLFWSIMVVRKYWSSPPLWQSLEVTVPSAVTNGFSKKLEHHEAAVSLYVAHYNLCRVHEAHGNMTPAMSLGITDHVWSLGELIDAALAIVPDDLGRRRKPVTLTVIDGGKE